MVAARARLSAVDVVVVARVGDVHLLLLLWRHQLLRLVVRGASWRQLGALGQLLVDLLPTRREVRVDGRLEELLPGSRHRRVGDPRLADDAHSATVATEAVDGVEEPADEAQHQRHDHPGQERTEGVLRRHQTVGISPMGDAEQRVTQRDEGPVLLQVRAPAGGDAVLPAEGGVARVHPHSGHGANGECVGGVVGIRGC